jgi:hypothetical protein
MSNIFSEIEEIVLFDDNLMFEETKIKEHIQKAILEKLNSTNKENIGFLFEEIVYNFLEYMNISFIKTKKTRDYGIDGVIKTNIGFFGEVNLGVQVKYVVIDSNDIDLFIASLKNLEIQLGVIICKDSRNLEKYELNSKIKGILFSKGINIKEKLIKDKVNINPVLVLKFDEIVGIVSSQIRAVVRGIYKK